MILNISFITYAYIAYIVLFYHLLYAYGNYFFFTNCFPVTESARFYHIWLKNPPQFMHVLAKIGVVFIRYQC